MHKLDPTHAEMEKALLELMPVALREESQARMEAMIDGLCGASNVGGSGFRKAWNRLVATGIAAALMVAIFLSVNLSKPEAVPVADSKLFTSPELVLLTESDRVEKVSDDGLFIDTGGSAMRKVRFRVVEESQIRDEETGIVVMLTSPREEMYMVPVSTF